ncbi:MAG: heme o synthase [Phycisphaerales bacterium]|nr:heme o synthase [Phycisphaerales bacterium]
MSRSTPTIIRVDEIHRVNHLAALIESGKPGITKMVTITAGVGFLLAALGRSGWAFQNLALAAVGAIVGTALASAGANALNMWYEADTDAKMRRTRNRPIPTGRLTRKQTVKTGVLLSIVGVLITLVFAGTAAALVCLLCVVSYVLLYTPMKTRTVWNTLLGTIPGALPPMIGAAAATPGFGHERLFSPVGWSLVALMVVWQIPHFLAIAWLYRDDYERGGHRMLPIIDRSGRLTSAVVVGTALLLIPATVLPVYAAPHMLGVVTLVAAIATGLAYLALCVRLALKRDDKAAKLVFFASIIHLPVLLIVMVAEAGFRVLL